MRTPRSLAKYLIVFLLSALTFCPTVKSKEHPESSAAVVTRGGGRHQRKPMTQRMTQRSTVGMTLVPGAIGKEAVCLDGSSPAYHFDRGSGGGASSWLLQFEGGGWCDSVESCLARSVTRRGSTKYMRKLEVFSGILSSDPIENPDYYNWNRVKLRYCDGASFGGNSIYRNNTTVLYFRGQRIWEAIVEDLVPKGLGIAKKALLSGCSAGGLATFIHCDEFKRLLPETATVKCLSDAGFFLDAKDVSGNKTMMTFFNGVVDLHGVQQNLNGRCTAVQSNPRQCFFPQYALPFTQTPFFILNSAYDIFQINHIFVPPSADPHEHWASCKHNMSTCTTAQNLVLEGYRIQMLEAVFTSYRNEGIGFFINSCYAHCQSELQEDWFEPFSPRIQSKTIAGAVGDWFYERRDARWIDAPHPSDQTCRNPQALIFPDNNPV